MVCKCDHMQAYSDIICMQLIQSTMVNAVNLINCLKYFPYQKKNVQQFVKYIVFVLLRDCCSDDGKQCSFQHSEAHSTSRFLSHGLLSVKIIFSEDFLCLFWSLTATSHYKLSLHGKSCKTIPEKCVPPKIQQHTGLEQHEGE